MGNNKNVRSYFPHDSNARNDSKLLALRIRHKAAGYGVYFMILERLREETNYMSVKDYNLIAFDLREDASLIKSVVEDFGLFAFTPDGECFYSEGFSRRMEIKDKETRRRSEAGKKGMQARWNEDVDNNVIENDNNVIKSDNSVITMLPKKDNKKEKKESKVLLKEKDKEKVPVASVDRREKSLKECYTILSGDVEWSETLTMNTRSSGQSEFTLETFHGYLERFFAKLQNEGETKKSVRDAKAHFSRWLAIELQKKDGNTKQSAATSKSAANDYAMQRYLEERRRVEAGMASEVPKPF